MMLRNRYGKEMWNGMERNLAKSCDYRRVRVLATLGKILSECGDSETVKSKTVKVFGRTNRH